MNLDKEIAWIETRMEVERSTINDQRSTNLKMYGRLLELCIKVRDKGLKRKKADLPKYERFKEFISAYDLFIRDRTNGGIGALIDGIQGKALNNIITYLVSQAKTKDEAGALEAWRYILANWKMITPYLQQQVALYSIYKNLSEILDQLKNGHFKQKQASHTQLSDLKSSLTRK
jgi:hypothetical protein